MRIVSFPTVGSQTVHSGAHACPVSASRVSPPGRRAHDRALHSRVKSQMRFLVLVGLWASLPLLAGYSALASCARCLKNPARSARFVSSANPSKEELLARLAEMEQAKFAAERAAAPPPATRKSPLEKLRIVFGGKRSIPTTASAKLLIMPKDPPTEHPTVALPPGFAPPVARPFVPTGDYMTLLSAVAALLIRCLAGLFVVGWRPRLSFRPPPTGEYRLRLGPLYLSETSDVLALWPADRAVV